MKQRSVMIRMILITTLLIALAVYAWQVEGQAASPGKEKYRVGQRDIIIGDEGNTIAGDYVDPTPKGSGVKTIYLAFTCVSNRPLFNDIIPAFKEYWYQKTGERVRFETGYSTLDFDKIATKVNGESAHVLISTSAHDSVRRGYETTRWQKESNGGVVYSTPVVFLVRQGNPKGIYTYEDLTRPEVMVVHPNPINAAGFWPVYGIYGSALKGSEVETGRRDKQAALELLREVEQNAVYNSSTSLGAGIQFLEHEVGDVLLWFESRALTTVAKNDSVEMVIPPNTVMADLTVYKMKKIKNDDYKTLIDEFIDFLFNSESQDSFAKYGFRPSDKKVLSRHREFVSLENPFPVDYLGNATQLKKELVLDKWVKINNARKGLKNTPRYDVEPIGEDVDNGPDKEKGGTEAAEVTEVTKDVYSNSGQE